MLEQHKQKKYIHCCCIKLWSGSMLSESVELCLDFFFFFSSQYEVLHHSRVQIHLFLMGLEKCQCLSVYFVTLLLCCR